VSAAGLRTAAGVFGAHMAVELVNDGPVTFVIEQRSLDRRDRASYS
jgi:D-tyrosyl-tRNA(Tyr) deacylase